jgi:predicted nucleic acid-binding protein
MQQGSLRASDVPNAHLAALAIEHGLKLATSDSGFARFQGLEWFDPLRGGRQSKDSPR